MFRDQQIIVGYLYDVLRYRERRWELYGRLVALQSEYRLELLTKAQVIGLVRITKANGSLCNGSNGADVILWIEP
jgi:hypothetical protein